MKATVYGYGINDYNGKVSVQGKHIKSYNCWRTLIKECYVNKNGYKISNDWLSFSNFKKFFDEHYIDGYVLDTKILMDNSKEYSDKTCVFVPLCVNKYLIKYNDGVYFNSTTNLYYARLVPFGCGKRVYLGSYITYDKANEAYIKARKTEILKIKEYLKQLGYSEDIIKAI